MFLKQAYEIGLRLALSECGNASDSVTKIAEIRKRAEQVSERHPHDVAGAVLGSLSGAGLGLAGGSGLGMLASDDLRKIIASGLLGAAAGSAGGGYLGHKNPELAGGVFGGLSGGQLGATVGNELGALADASPETKAALRAVLGLGGMGGGAYLGHRLLSRD